MCFCVFRPCFAIQYMYFRSSFEIISVRERERERETERERERERESWLLFDVL